MATTGFTLGTSAAQVLNTSMTYTGGVGLANILVEDDTVITTAGITTKNAEAIVEVSNFGFDALIPAGSTITQVNFRHRGQRSNGAAAHECFLRRSGTDGTASANANTALTTVTVNAATRPGGGSWDRSDLLDGTLTVRVHSLQPNNTTSRTYQWAWVEVEVVYTAPTPPTVTTQAVSSIATTTATGNGNVTDDGLATVTERGVVANTTGTPTTSDLKFTAGAGGTGAFTASMTSLGSGTHYYVRAYAINTEGTSYGSQVEFDTTSSASPRYGFVNLDMGVI